MKGLFISFEGPDASGKTTQLSLLREYLLSLGLDPLMTREPGGTPISEKIRDIILDKANGEMLPVTEALLYAAARAQHVGQLIRPALREGRIVISDRFLDSSVAYQGYGRKLGGMVEAVNAPAVAGLEPDLTVLLYIEPAEMRSRRSAEEEDRMDAQKNEFHMDVLAGYLSLADAHRDRIVLIDARRGISEVAADVRSAAEALLRKRGFI